MRLIALSLLFLLLPASAQAERLVSTLSNTDIEISSSFNGETLTAFGTIEPDLDAKQKFVEGPYHVVIVIEGPLSNRVARQVTNRFGIWSNTDQVVFEGFPSYFHVLASDMLKDITNVVTLTVENILPEAQARESAKAGWWKSSIFGRELVRLMTEKGLFGVDDQGVRFLSDTSYRASITLPSDVPNGPFIARTYVFKDGAIVARDSEGFSVRKSGFERFIFISASTYPLFYGLACVLLALGTGWLGGVIFKR